MILYGARLYAHTHTQCVRKPNSSPSRLAQAIVDSLHRIISYHRGARFDEGPVAAAAAALAPRSAPPPPPLLSATATATAAAADTDPADATPPARRLRRSVSLSPPSIPPSAAPPPPPSSATVAAPKGDGAALPPLLLGELGRGGVFFGFDHGGDSRGLWAEMGGGGGCGWEAGRVPGVFGQITANLHTCVVIDGAS